MMQATRRPGGQAWLITDQPGQPTRQSFTADEWARVLTARRAVPRQSQAERNRRDARAVKAMFLTFGLLMALMTLLGWVLS